MEKELHLLNTMLGKQVDGIVFMGGNITDEHVAEFKRSPVPIVLAASVEEQEETPSVAIDYEQAIYDAVKLLVDKGHTDIAFVSGPMAEPINRSKKLQGYKRALEEANLPFNEQFVAEGDYTYGSGLEALQHLMSLDKNRQPFFLQLMKWHSALSMPLRIRAYPFRRISTLSVLIIQD